MPLRKVRPLAARPSEESRRQKLEPVARMSGAPLNRAARGLSQTRRDIRGTPACRHGGAPVVRPCWLMRATAIGSERYIKPVARMSGAPLNGARSCLGQRAGISGVVHPCRQWGRARGATLLAHAGYAIGSRALSSQ